MTKDKKNDSVPARRPAPSSPVPQPAQEVAAPPPSSGLGAPMPGVQPPGLDPGLIQHLALLALGHHPGMPSGDMGQQQMGQQMGGQQPMPQQAPPNMPQTILGQSIGARMQPPQSPWGGGMPPAQQAAQAGQTPGQTGGQAPPPGQMNHPAPMPQPLPQMQPQPPTAQSPARTIPQVLPPAYEQKATYHQPRISQNYPPPMPERPVAGTTSQRGR